MVVPLTYLGQRCFKNYALGPMESSLCGGGIGFTIVTHELHETQS